MLLSSFSINLPAFYIECRSLIGYATHVVLNQLDYELAGRYQAILRQVRCSYRLLRCDPVTVPCHVIELDQIA